MNKKVLILGVLTVLLSITIAIGFSYAVWTQTKEQDVANTFSVGCFNIEITKQENTINLNNDYPITDETGKTRVPFTFTVTNTCDYYGNYAVNLEKLTTSNMESQFIKVMLDNGNPDVYSNYPSGEVQSKDTNESRILFTGGLAPGKSATHSLRIWIDYDATVDDVGGKTFQGKIVINSVMAEQPSKVEIDEVIAAKANPSQIATDDPDNNLRYIGQNPNNYVKFNDENWRIIGVFNTYVCEDSVTGKQDDYKTNPKCKQEKLLKIIRNDFLSTEMAWDTNDANDWSNASLQKILNGEYFSKSGSYTSTGLKDTAQGMVANVVWTLGGTASYDSASNGLASHFYGYERGETVYTGRPKAFVGKVGLMFPSDYGYATGGGSTGRSTCLAKEMYNWDGSSECYNNDWLFNSSYYQWTLSPRSDNSNYVFYVAGPGGGSVYDFYADITYGVRPVVYLKSSVKILDDGMDGSSTKPYNLNL